MLGQGITLMESNRADDEELATSLLEEILPYTGGSMRIGITGIPGVGKSTFIESFGNHVISHAKKLAVLSIDPTSPLTGGSILGDKTRMDTLSKDPRAFIRPTPSSSSIGGVSMRTRESILLCEAAGYDVVIVETVGVGQSEFAVKEMIDFFLLLMIPGAGDELQGMKKGINELADAIIITKADGANHHAAMKAQAIYAEAMHWLETDNSWATPVLTSSAITGQGISEVWSMVNDFFEQSKANGRLDASRRAQQSSWFNSYFAELLNEDVRKHARAEALRIELESDVISKNHSVRAAARQLLEAYRDEIRNNKS